MKMQKLIYSFLILLVFSACSDDEGPGNTPDPEPVGAYSNGIFVVNEGNFGSPNSSISFISQDGMVTNNIFQSANNGNLLGDTAQGLFLTENLAIITVNNSNKVEVVNRDDFTRVALISDRLASPRYATVDNGTIYVSNWSDGTNPDDDFIALYSVDDFEYVDRIDVPEGPEKLVVADNKLFVLHKGGFSFNDIVSVIDLSTNEIIDEIEVGDVPSSFVLGGNDLYILSSGKPSYADMETAGTITRIAVNSLEVVSQSTIGDSTVHPDYLVESNLKLYYQAGNGIYVYQGSVVSDEPEFTIDDAGFIYGASASQSELYVAVPNSDFTGNGQVLVYDVFGGGLIDSYDVGINPNGIYFSE